MRQNSLQFIALAVGLCLVGSAAWAQSKGVDLGQREFLANCASCHGTDGKGNGPNKPYLTRSPTDLTVLAKNNGGILPAARMYEVIEGARDIPTHGSRDMPTWGHEYRVKAAEYYMDVPYSPEAYVRGRLLALVEYINRLQVK